MSRDAHVLRNGRVVYRYGFMRADAHRLAQKWAEQEPGRTYTVVIISEKYQYPRKKRKP